VADGLVKRGWSLTSVRKLCQGLAFVGPAICMLACAVLTPATPTAACNMPLLVGLLSLGFALGAWSRAGLYCNHQVGCPGGMQAGGTGSCRSQAAFHPQQCSGSGTWYQHSSGRWQRMQWWLQRACSRPARLAVRPVLACSSGTCCRFMHRAWQQI
jgi:hypothetical protein